MNATTATQTLTVERRWKRGIETARSKGVRIRQNLKGCCRGCISHVDVAPDAPYAWTYGGQGDAYAFDQGAMVWANGKARRARRASAGPLRSNEVVDAVYFNHNGALADGTPAAQVIADTFREEGFTVDWDGDLSHCVIVKIGHP